MPADPGVVELLAQYEGPVLEAQRMDVGRTTVDLLGDPLVVRRQETNLGDMAADASMAFALSKAANLQSAEAGGKSPMVVLINAGSIRQSIPRGDITLSDLSDTFPYGNWIVIKEVTGPLLVAALENAVAKVDAIKPGGAFAQVAGLRYSFDARKPAGSRIINALVNTTAGWVPAAQLNDITLATTNYVGTTGGDGYGMLAPSPLLLDTSTMMDEVLRFYLMTASPVSPAVDGRIVDCSSSQAGASSSWGTAPC